MSITCFSLLCTLLLSLQASTARHLRLVPHSKDPAAQDKRQLLLNLSHKNDDGTKAKNSDIPSKENATLLREQQKGSITLSESDQEINVEGDKKDHEQQATKSGPVLEPIKKDHNKMLKSQDNLSGAQNPVTVSWHVPQQQRRKKKKKRGMSHDPELALDYAPPRVHPPCHN